MLRRLHDLIGLFVPFDRDDEDEPNGGAGSADDDPDAGGTGEGEGDRDALDRAATLEAANSRIEELERENQRILGSVEERAEQMLNEVMPDLGSLSRSAPPSREAPRERYLEVDGERVAPEDMTPEQIQALELQQLRQRVQGMEDQQFADRLNGQLDALQARLPNMNRHRVVTFLGTLPEDQAAKVNVGKLCEISHQKETNRLEAYANEKIAAKLAEISGGPKPPPVPGRGAGDPVNDDSPKTWSSAKAKLAEKLAARGFGR